MLRTLSHHRLILEKSVLEMHIQAQSLLFRLPAEVRSLIYTYALSSCKPIVDPVIGYSTRLQHYKSLPELGTALLRTCKFIHKEMDVRSLYTSNEFVFTRPSICSDFLNSLSLQLCALVTTVTLDLRNNVRGKVLRPESVEEWMHYLVCDRGRRHRDGRTLCATHPFAPEAFHLAQISTIKTVVLDVRELQRATTLMLAVPEETAVANGRGDQWQGLWMWFEACRLGISAVNFSLEIWVRYLDEQQYVREVLVPGGMRSDEKEREEERNKTLLEWRKMIFDI